jgi:hypothetical protein
MKTPTARYTCCHRRHCTVPVKARIAHHLANALKEQLWPVVINHANQRQYTGSHIRTILHDPAISKTAKAEYLLFAQTELSILKAMFYHHWQKNRSSYQIVWQILRWYIKDTPVVLRLRYSTRKRLGHGRSRT